MLATPRMSDLLLRVYLDPNELLLDGYPHRWHHESFLIRTAGGEQYVSYRQADEALWRIPEFSPQAAHRVVNETKLPPIKNLVRDLAEHRCERCGHPYQKGEHERGEWTPCDEHCTHGGPVRFQGGPVGLGSWEHYDGPDVTACEYVEARWRILTVHHLNGVKHDCRWWNLAALCQRCHLTIQGRVTMERSYFGEHTEWFKPHAAGFYATHFLGVDLDRGETLARLDELLALEHRQLELTAPAEDGENHRKETGTCSPPAA